MLGQRPGPDGVDRSADARAELERLALYPGAWTPATADELPIELARVFRRDLPDRERSFEATRRARTIARHLASAHERSPVPAIAHELGLSLAQTRKLVSAHRERYQASAHDAADERSPEGVSA